MRRAFIRRLERNWPAGQIRSGSARGTGRANPRPAVRAVPVCWVGNHSLYPAVCASSRVLKRCTTRGIDTGPNIFRRAMASALVLLVVESASATFVRLPTNRSFLSSTLIVLTGCVTRGSPSFPERSGKLSDHFRSFSYCSRQVEPIRTAKIHAWNRGD